MARKKWAGQSRGGAWVERVGRLLEILWGGVRGDRSADRLGGVPYKGRGLQG